MLINIYRNGIWKWKVLEDVIQLKMMRVLTEDDCFELKQNEREGVVNMSEVLDRVEAEGRREGRL